MKTSDFNYELPPEFIAQTPIEPRDSARLMVLDRNIGSIEHSHFRSIGKYLRSGDLIVLNETRVLLARLFAIKVPTGGKVEILLLKNVGIQIWECIVRGKGLRVGVQLLVNKGPGAIILAELGEARRLIKFEYPVETILNEIGNVPLPPYIKKPIDNPERYQTIYAKQPGSAAAPTAGLHFTKELIKLLKDNSIKFCNLTLHIGLDTFKPVTEGDPRDHEIHSEWCSISQQTAKLINETKRKGGRVIAVGTTSVRTLESAAINGETGNYIRSFEGETDLFILPGYQFRIVDAMITNFHLPQSTLIMLVSAFANREKIINAYRCAIKCNYRFYSFGDAMFIT
jgi:S-adenosylmethionine:tRNA ribosyltransferase-isomerase